MTAIEINAEIYRSLAYQYYCAIENGCEAIVTINMKHFKGKHNEDIPVYTPSEFVDKFLEIENGQEQSTTL